MKSAFVGMVSVMLLVIAITFMSCTSQITPTSSNVSLPTSSSTYSANNPSLSASSTLPQVDSIVNSSSVLGTNYTWIEYMTVLAFGKFGTITENVDMKTGRSMVTYKEQPAIRMETTYTTPTNLGPEQEIDDIYYDTGMDTMLGATKTTTVAGHHGTQSISSAPFPTQGLDYFLHESQLTFAVIDSVVVPAGLYPNAYKYTGSLNQTAVTLWTVPGIPVPVQETVSFPGGEFNITLELEGWG